MSTKSILIVGALLAEVLPVLRMLTEPTVLHHRLVRGKWNNCIVYVLRCGVGPKASFRRTKETLSAITVERVVSIGTCGALVDNVAIGDVFTSTVCHFEDGRYLEIEALTAVDVLPLITVSKPVLTPQRRQYFQPKAALCEMEAFCVALASENVPVHALKVVSDHAGRDPDPAMSTSFIKAHRIAQFMLRAGYLSRTSLVPVLERCLL